MENKHKYLRAALYVFGVIFVVGVPAMMMLLIAGAGLRRNTR